MPMPFTYQSATRDFEAYLDDLRTISGLATRNQCYTMTRSVFLVFRAHVPSQAAIDFAQFLPAVLRAIFIEEWNLAATVTPFPDAVTLAAEVCAIREAHNFSTPTAIREVAEALRHAMKPEGHAAMLAKLPADAKGFWVTV